MQLNTDGLVIKEQKVGETDRLITILTRDRGVIRAFANGAYTLKHKNASSTQTLCYSKFILYHSKSGYTVNDAEAQELFYGLRQDIEKLSLAQYFCELALILVPEEVESEGILRLLLNTLYYLSRGLKDTPLLKGVYELRILSESGMMPDLIMCERCGVYESERMYFLPREAKLQCENCMSPEEPHAVSLGKGALTALRHSIYADASKLFSFSLSPDSLKSFARAAEEYLLLHIQQKPGTLNFYHGCRG